jgi:4-diphosphocytidyl-2-C-methyl-D-erythritol kinase
VLTGIEEGVKVFVEKHIPAGGGLGGGSSNASTFLKSLDILFNTRLNLQSFLDISGKVGSDCFFFTYALCLQSEQDGVFRPFTALVEGRGEKVSPIQSRTDLSFLLVFPKVSVSTKEAYALVDKQINKTLRSKIGFEQMYKKPIECWEFKNDFTIPVSSGYNQISTALADLRKSGSDFVDMSGSGSTVFAAFVDKERAINAMNELSSKWHVVLV